MTLLTLKTFAMLVMANLALAAAPTEPAEDADIDQPPAVDRGEVYRDPPYAPRPRPDRDYPPEVIDLLVGGATHDGERS